MSKIKMALFRVFGKPMMWYYKRQIGTATSPSKNSVVRAAVLRNRTLRPHLRRITLASPDFASIEFYGYDEYVGLMMPRPGQDLVLPDPDVANPREAVAAIPDEQRPDMRWYTIRATRATEIDIDIVTHGDNGPGSRWALSASPGDEVGVRFLNRIYEPIDAPCVLIADAAGNPAACAVVETMSAEQRARTHLISVTIDADAICQLDEELRDQLASYHYLEAPLAEQATQICELIDQLEGLEYAWLGAESDVVKLVRRHLVTTVKLPKTAVYFASYWREGHERP